MYEIYRVGNYVYLNNNGNEYNLPVVATYYTKLITASSTTIKIMCPNLSVNITILESDFIKFVDVNAVSYTISSLYDFLNKNTGLTDSVYYQNPFQVVNVCSLSDLPTPVSGVITLEDSYTYQFTCHVDLDGNRLVCGEDTTILGKSSENCSITSTGLSAGAALITATYSVPIRHITIIDVDTALDFDGTGNVMALDWTGVNFENVPNIGTVKTVSNFILSKCALLNSKGLIFDGTIATIGLDNNLFQGDGLAGDIINVASTCVITRRFRMIYSSVVAFGSTVGINFSTSATVPFGGYILSEVNFTGGGTYISGVQSDDNKSRFQNVFGVDDSADVATYYMNGNSTITTISAVDTPTKILGTTSAGTYNQRFDVTTTSNRAERTGVFDGLYKLTGTVAIEGGNNKEFSIYIAKNGTVSNPSRSKGTTSGVGRAEGVPVQDVFELSVNDYLELWVENNSDSTDLTATDLNVIIEKLNI